MVTCMHVINSTGNEVHTPCVTVYRYGVGYILVSLFLLSGLTMGTIHVKVLQLAACMPMPLYWCNHFCFRSLADALYLIYMHRYMQWVHV